jgi:chromosome segregation ATPase
MRKIFSVFMVLFMVLAVVSSLYAGPSEQQIGKRIAELQQRIDEGMRAGTLTPAESKNLQSKLDKIREHVDKAQGKRYGLSDGEVKSVNNRLDALSKDVYREKHDLQTTRTGDQITHRINEMKKRIESGYRDGSLTGSEAKSLQARLDGIQDHFERAQKRGFGEQDIRAIDRKLDVLSKDISKERHDRQRAR